MVAAAFRPNPGSLVSIAVTPASPSIAAGLTQQFSATGTYADGSTQNLTAATWNSATPSVASISAAGLATGAAAGTSSITAAYGSITSNPATLTVTPPALVSIAVTPVSTSIATGLTQQFSATGTYSDGSTQNLTAAVTWNSATPSVATISGGGLATGVARGTSSITVVHGSITSSPATLAVGEPSSITLVNQVSAGDSTGGLSGSIAAPAADHLAGDLLVVICRNGTSWVSQTAPTDTAGNTYVGLTPAADANVGVIQMWYAKNIIGNAGNVVSCHFALPDAWRSISVLQYAGADPGNPLDSQASASSGTSIATSGVTPAVTPSRAGGLVVVGATVGGALGMTFSAGAGFTLRDSGIGTFSGDEDEIVAAAGPVVPGMSWGPSPQLWAMVAAAFK